MQITWLDNGNDCQALYFNGKLAVASHDEDLDFNDFLFMLKEHAPDMKVSDLPPILQKVFVDFDEFPETLE